MLKTPPSFADGRERESCCSFALTTIDGRILHDSEQRPSTIVDSLARRITSAQQSRICPSAHLLESSQRLDQVGESSLPPVATG